MEIVKQQKDNLIELYVVKARCCSCKWEDSHLANPDSKLSLASARDALMHKHDIQTTCTSYLSFFGGFGKS